MSVTNTQNTHPVGAPPPSGGNAGPQPLTGDKALLAVMLMQLYELNVLATAADSEGELSVALRTTMQNKMTEKLEEYEKMLEFCSAADDGGTKFNELKNWANGSNGSNKDWPSLLKAFANDPAMTALLQSIPKDCQGDFASYLLNNIVSNSNGDATQFRNNVANLSQVLNQVGTYQNQCKNLADGFQNGAGNLAQSITQFLAQLSSEGSLLGDVVAQ